MQDNHGLRCGQCGQPLPGVRLADESRKPSWQQQELHRARIGDVPDVPFSSLHRQTPTRPASVGSEVAVPALSALVSGLFVLVTGMMLAYWLGALDTWPVVVLVSALVALLVWFVLLSDGRQLLRIVEDVIGADLDGDGEVGEPQPATVGVRLEVEDGNARQYRELPIDRRRLGTLARGIRNGRSFSLREWDSLITRTEYEALRDWLLRDGYMEWVNPDHRQQGLQNTARGEALWRALADRSPTPEGGV